MPQRIYTDNFGPFVRCNGYLFRPLFPLDYPPAPTGTKFPTGRRVHCEHRVGTPLVVVHALNSDLADETWFAHGQYIRPRGSFKQSQECYKPDGFTWKGGIADRMFN